MAEALTVLVPIEPTPAMIKAYKNAMRELIREARANGTANRWPKRKRGYGITEREKCFCRWKAMLEAAPSTPSTDTTQHQPRKETP